MRGNYKLKIKNTKKTNRREEKEGKSNAQTYIFSRGGQVFYKMTLNFNFKDSANNTRL